MIMKMSFMKKYELPVLTGKFIGLNAFLGKEKTESKTSKI